MGWGIGRKPNVKGDKAKAVNEVNSYRYRSPNGMDQVDSGTAVTLSGIGEFEVLKLERQEDAEPLLYKIFGISAAHDQAFAEIRIEARHTIMVWNEYVADAWFVDWPDRKERS